MSKQSLKNSNVVKLKPKNIKCEFCKKIFSEEDIDDHWCNKKKRLKQRHKKEFIVSYEVFKIWKKYNNFQKDKEITVNDFCKFRYYTTFMKFGKMFMHLGSKELEQFTSYLTKNCIPFIDWKKMETFNKWLVKKTYTEDPIDASESAIKIMMEWERETENLWNDFFREVNINVAYELILTGKLSPWLIFSGIANDLLERMSEEQLVDLTEKLDIKFWADTINNHYDEIEYIKKVYKEFLII